MVVNPALQYYPLPIYYVRIVPERKNTRGRDLGGEEDLRPRLSRVAGGLCLLAVAC